MIDEAQIRPATVNDIAATKTSSSVSDLKLCLNKVLPGLPLLEMTDLDLQLTEEALAYHL